MSKLIIDYNQNKQPDFIGDIHGHFYALVQLFEKMGYTYNNGIYTHPDRFPVIIGDYIDRGPKIFETVELVKKMQETGNAIALMGNHELNFLELNHKDKEGNSFRSQDKRGQVKETDAAFKGKDLDSYLNWMAQLPIALESEHFRAVHAQWEVEAVENIKTSTVDRLDEEGLRSVYAISGLYKSIEILLKGKELKLPENLQYKEYDSPPRTEARIKWWQARKRTFFGIDFASLPEHMIDKDISEFNHDYEFYYEKKYIPVFFGHYWMDAKKVKLMSSNACCVDYSIAKAGILVAYRHTIGQVLKNKNFIKHNKPNQSKKIKKEVVVPEYERMFRDAYKYLDAYYDHWTLDDSKVVARYLCKKFYRLKYQKGITIIEIVSEGCAKIRKPKSQITYRYWLSDFSKELEYIYIQSKTEEYNDEYSTYASLIQNEDFSGFDNYKNIELYEDEIINGDTLSSKEKELFELLINVSLADLEGELYKTLNIVAVESGLTEKDSAFRKAYQRLREKLLNLNNKGSLDHLTFATIEHSKKASVIADFFKYVDSHFIMENHLQAYRFSEQEMNKMIELKKIFEENGFEINRFPEVYIDEEYCLDELDNLYENPDRFGCYKFFVNDEKTTQEGIIIIYSKAIKDYCSKLELNKNHFALIVLMHELGHWLSHWPKCNNQNWSDGYSADDKKSHESFAQLIAYWAADGNPELEKTLTYLTPTDPENPYYLYNNLKEFSKINILKKLRIVRIAFQTKKLDYELYDILKMNEEEFDKKYLGFFPGEDFGI